MASPTIDGMVNAMKQQGREIHENELANDPLWIEASKKIYKLDYGTDFKGQLQDAVKYGLNRMAEFNYNMTLGTIPDTVKVGNADKDTQIAFAYLMDTYDNKDVTLAGFGRAAKQIALDPLSYVGIGTLGTGFVAKKGAQSAAKTGFKTMLHNSIKSYLSSTTATVATETAGYAGGQNLAEQTIKTKAGLQPEINKTELATQTALGAGLGAGFVQGGKAIGKAIKGNK